MLMLHTSGICESKTDRAKQTEHMHVLDGVIQKAATCAAAANSRRGGGGIPAIGYPFSVLLKRIEYSIPRGGQALDGSTMHTQMRLMHPATIEQM